MNSEISITNKASNNDFWEDTFLEALDEKSQFLESYESHCRSYPKNEVLGKGGVKTVYKSFDWKTNRDIALASPSKEGDEDLSVEFIHEAIVLGQLEHPNIIPVYDTGLDESKVPYFTMKLVRGKDLKAHLDDQGKPESLKELPELLEIYKKVCQAVSYAHSKNILHLDIKPGNILIGQFGEVFLCDWGLSEKSDDIKKTIDEKLIKGTPGFMAPELLEKKVSDNRMDIYSLGCLLYFILSRKPPIEGDGLTEFVIDLSRNKIKPLESVCSFPLPQSLMQIFEKCCQENPDDRYQKVSEIIEDLELYTNGFATKAEEAGFLRNLQLLYKRNQVKINIIIFFTFLLSGLSAYYVMNLKESTRIAIEQKDKAEQLTDLLLFKQEEDRKFIQETMNTADYTFGKGRSDSTRRFLENSLMVDPDNEKTLFNLAQVHIVNGKWKKARTLLSKVKSYETDQVKTLSLLISKYEKLPDNIDSQFQLSLEAFDLGFQEIYRNVSHDVLNDVPHLSDKIKFIKIYLGLENRIKNLDFSYDSNKAELVIKNAKLDKLRTLKYLHIKTLRLLDCDISCSISNTIAITVLDLRNSKFSHLNEHKFKGVETLYMPLNKASVKFQHANFLKTVYLPKKVYKKPSIKGFSGKVKFY